jgi:hypothetical protein
MAENPHFSAIGKLANLSIPDYLLKITDPTRKRGSANELTSLTQRVSTAQSAPKVAGP